MSSFHKAAGLALVAFAAIVATGEKPVTVARGKDRAEMRANCLRIEDGSGAYVLLQVVDGHASLIVVDREGEDAIEIGSVLDARGMMNVQPSGIVCVPERDR